MAFKAVVFDLDGTLLDTLADIAHAANRALATHGYPPHDIQAYRYFVGDGSAVLMSRALPEAQRTSHQVKACLDSFLEDYNRNWDQATQPYEGIPELLADLMEREISLAVVTNKPHRFTGQMMDHYFGDLPFNPVLGQRAGIPKKPHPQQALVAAEQMGVHPSACIFLGDSAVDMETARGAGMHSVGAGWGFRPARELYDAGAACVIDHPLDLLASIQT